AFYTQMNADHRRACAPLLEREADLKARLRGVVQARIDAMEPYHRFAATLFRSAADPQSPLSPFGAESSAARLENTELFAEVLDGSTARIPADLRAELPDLLWLYHMGIVLFWLHDDSPESVRTRRLIHHSTDLVTRAISLASAPILRPLRKT